MDPAQLQMMMAMQGQVPGPMQAVPMGQMMPGLVGAPGAEAFMGAAAMMAPPGACGGCPGGMGMGIPGMAVPGMPGLMGIPGGMLSPGAGGCPGLCGARQQANQAGSPMAPLPGKGGAPPAAASTVAAGAAVAAESSVNGCGGKGGAASSRPPKPNHNGTLEDAAKDFARRHKQDKEFLNKLLAHLEKKGSRWEKELGELEKEIDGVPLICRNQVLLVKMGKLVPQKWTDYDDPEDVAAKRDSAARNRASPARRRSRSREERRERSKSRERRRRKSRSRS